MVNSGELIGSTEYLTLYTRCRINRCRYNRVRLHFVRPFVSLFLCFPDFIPICLDIFLPCCLSSLIWRHGIVSAILAPYSEGPWFKSLAGDCTVISNLLTLSSCYRMAYFPACPTSESTCSRYWPVPWPTTAYAPTGSRVPPLGRYSPLSVRNRC